MTTVIRFTQDQMLGPCRKHEERELTPEENCQQWVRQVFDLYLVSRHEDCPLPEQDRSQVVIAYDQFRQAADRGDWIEAGRAATIIGLFLPPTPETRAIMADAAKEDFASEFGTDGGEKSGEVRRIKAEEKWEAEALIYALFLRDETPSLSQLPLADEIAFLWQSKTPLRKSMLPERIREWERAGLLPRRKK